MWWEKGAGVGKGLSEAAGRDGTWANESGRKSRDMCS